MIPKVKVQNWTEAKKEDITCSPCSLQAEAVHRLVPGLFLTAGRSHSEINVFFRITAGRQLAFGATQVADLEQETTRNFCPTIVSVSPS